MLINKKLIVGLGLASVVTLVMLLVSLIVAPTSGFEFSSVTFPTTVDCWAKRKPFNKSIVSNDANNFFCNCRKDIKRRVTRDAQCSSIKFRYMAICFELKN